MKKSQALSLYIGGFIGSLILTVTSFLLVVNQVFETWTTVLVITALAIVQAAVQLICFFHLGAESKPRWRLNTLGFMLSILVVIVVGSIWIMNDLNYRMMYSPDQMQEYMDSQSGF